MGTFERHGDLKGNAPAATALYRDRVIAWSKDLGRALDYLETRTELDRDRVAYFGYSWGAAVAPKLLAVEDRFKVAVLLSGGFVFERVLPEVDSINFIGHVHIPVLMLNGRYDSTFPVETSQRPFFELLGTPPTQKRHLLYDAGHAAPRKETIRDTLRWLDTYLGPVGG
jgi:predicted esterase